MLKIQIPLTIASKFTKQHPQLFDVSLLKTPSCLHKTELN